MQNAELRHSKDEVEQGVENCTAIYDFAPVGYFTLDTHGTISAANLTDAGMSRLLNTTVTMDAKLVA